MVITLAGFTAPLRRFANMLIRYATPLLRRRAATSAIRYMVTVTVVVTRYAVVTVYCWLRDTPYWQRALVMAMPLILLASVSHTTDTHSHTHTIEH